MKIIDKRIEPYIIDASDNQFTVKSLAGTNKDGEQLYNNHGYFTSLSSAIKKIVKMNSLNEEESNLDSYIDRLEYLNKQFLTID